MYLEIKLTKSAITKILDRNIVQILRESVNIYGLEGKTRNHKQKRGCIFLKSRL